MISLAVLQSLMLYAATSFANEAPRGLVVVANSGEDSVALVDLRRPNAPAKIVTRKHPQDVVVSADGLLAYVAEMGTQSEPGNTVAALDLHTHKIVKRISLGNATLPHLLVLSRDGQTLWATCAPQNTIVELDLRSGTVARVWDTRQKGSWLVAVTPDEKKLYTANFDAGTVSVIRRSDASVQVLSLGGQPIGIDVAPDGNEVWVSNFQSNTITVIDVATDRITQTFSAGGDGPARLKFTPDGKQVWVTEGRSEELVGFDAARRQVIRRTPTGKFSKGLLILPDGRHAFVCAVEDNRVVEVDLSTGRVLLRIPTGEGPEGVAWSGSK